MTNASSPPDIAGRVRKTIEKTFRVSDEIAPAEFRMGSLPGWDSLGHMRLVAELEEEFGVTFPAYLLAELLDVDRIVQEIENLQSS